MYVLEVMVKKKMNSKAFVILALLFALIFQSSSAETSKGTEHEGKKNYKCPHGCCQWSPRSSECVRCCFTAQEAVLMHKQSDNG